MYFNVTYVRARVCMCVCECVLVYVYEREKEKPLSFLLQIACLFRTSQIFTELSCKDFVKLTVKWAEGDWALCDRGFPFNAPYCLSEIIKQSKCSLDFLINVLCLHLNLKCVNRMRQSAKIRNKKCYNLMAFFCCSNKMTKCNDLI